ncbi:hypothetical protein L0156_13515 [bacterium]|nr:hypothetical protein [bacterium]
MARISWHRLTTVGTRVQQVISPDGRWLALPLGDGVAVNIWGVSTTDGKLQRFTDFENRPVFISRRISWSPDGRFIYAAVSEAESDIVLFDGLKF